MKIKKLFSLAIISMALILPLSIQASGRTRANAGAKKVTSTIGKYAPTQGCTVTNAIAVDLGLPSGTKWADRNVGAESPQAYGGLYRYGNKGKSGGQGCPKEHITGTKLDVATQKMGKKWRMPTANELRELWENCKYTHEEINGQKGFRLTGPNGNSIFLPLTGIMYNYGRSQAGDFAFYQSGEIIESNMYQVGFEVIALAIWEADNATFTPGMSSSSLGEGNPIRAVAVE